MLTRNSVALLGGLSEEIVQDCAGFLFLTELSQETHSHSTQRLRSFGQAQKDQQGWTIYFVKPP